MFKESSTAFTVITVISAFIGVVSPGANDLHLQDGVTIADIIYGDVFFEIIDPPELKYSYRIRPAKDFGPTFNESFLLKNIRLVPAIPIDACSDLHNTEDISGQVALIERGDCTFVRKTLAAQAAGARAAIITEAPDPWDPTYDKLIEMVDDNKVDSEVNIPSGFLLGTSGGTILRTLRKQRRKYAVINIPINMTFVSLGKMNQPPWIGW